MTRDTHPERRRSQDDQTTIKYPKNRIVDEQATNDHGWVVTIARDTLTKRRPSQKSDNNEISIASNNR
jgi:hypothetical protein